VNETLTSPVSTTTTRVAQMFPTLTSTQVERIASHGKRRTTQHGELLYDVGTLPVPFVVVSRGAIELLHPHEGTERLIQALGPGQFSGELNLLSGRRALARARVRDPGEVIVLEREELLRLVQTDFDLSEILMRAFILRRVALMEEGLGDVVVIGSKFCSGTLRVREFLSRNAHPYAYFDLEQDAEVQHLLDQFHVSVDDIPVLICRGELVLRNPGIAEIAECLGLNESVANTQVRDVLVIGAGPSGLAAAVFAASEGLDVLVMEANVPGGQAGASSKIENFFGFPTGITGQALTWPRLRAGPEVWRAGHRCELRTKAGPESQALRHREQHGPDRAGTHGHRRIRCRVSKAADFEPVALRGRGCLLRSDLHGVAALP
jgi:thioredoxin reductase (NADPH)